MSQGASNFNISFYQERIKFLEIELKKYVNYSRWWVIIRLSYFCMMIVASYLLFPYSFLSGIGLLGGFIIFLYLVRKSIENKERLNFIKRLIRINQQEIDASTLDYSSFGAGEKFVDPQHPYSYDMDLFGKRSLFQLLNRTVTIHGEKALANRLLSGIISREESLQTIDELTEKMPWCQNYLAYGGMLEKEETDRSIKEILEHKYEAKSWMNWLQYVFPIFALSLSLIYYFDIINGFLFLLGAVGVLFPIQRLLKITNPIHQTMGRIEKRLKAMQHQLTIIEEESWSSNQMKAYHSIFFEENENAKKGLTELSKLAKEVLYRDNVLVAVVLNFFLAWDIRLLWRFSVWKNRYQEYIAEWEKILFELEALISGATFRYNFKSVTSIPVLTEDGMIDIQGLGHPIIPIQKLITNDFQLSSDVNFTIITGPNMAGKSTFLRSIGINLILAKSGFHVFAKKFCFPDLKLYSSMRSSDDLKEETSYFHAELLRLRFIVDAIERGEKVFIILDEILKGTNSKDKEEGSAKFLKKLNQLGAKGIIATHDLSLTQLAENYSQIVNNYFDTHIEGEEISFDYKMRPGVAQNMNASFLLRKMGLVEE
ncbi:MAG: hypothetical protein H3C31_01930 [Brumimicrobium sp.]|nr:hypothetical protein [Brumimicrobium sp.]